MAQEIKIALEQPAQANTKMLVTRIYKVKATGEIKTQPVIVDVDGISVRPNNRLTTAEGRPVQRTGTPVSEFDVPSHRCTITMRDGSQLEVTEPFSKFKAFLQPVELASV